MSLTDPFVHDDGAYVLGALDAAGTVAFEKHLSTCAECRARVAEARQTAGMLARLKGSAMEAMSDGVDEPPETLLPGLLRRAARERARSRWLVGSAAAVAAACLITLTVVLFARTTPSATAPTQALAPLRPSLITATAKIVPWPWGTEIDLHCSYSAAEAYPFTYRLVVIDRSRQQHVAGDWALVPGQAGIDFRGGTAVAADQISAVQITAIDGTPLLQLTR